MGVFWWSIKNWNGPKNVCFFKNDGHVGEDVYFPIVDESTGPWGNPDLDNIEVQNAVPRPKTDNAKFSQEITGTWIRYNFLTGAYKEDKNLIKVGFPFPKTFGNVLGVNNNHGLPKLDAFENSIPVSDIHIQNKDALTNVDGFVKLQLIGDSLSIMKDVALMEVSGFQIL